jgi:Domain of unknown function (DUF4410)
VAPILRWRAALSAVGVLALVLLASCGTTPRERAKDDKAAAPQAQPAAPHRTVVLGEVTTSDENAKELMAFFRIGFENRLKRAKGVDLLDHMSDAAPPDAVIVAGDIDDFDEGNRAARIIVGFGAGKARAHGDFAIRDTQGQVLARFESVKTGSLGIVEMNDLMQKLGAATAEAVLRWSKGQPLPSTAKALDSAQ